MTRRAAFANTLVSRHGRKLVDLAQWRPADVRLLADATCAGSTAGLCRRWRPELDAGSSLSSRIDEFRLLPICIGMCMRREALART